MIFPHSFSEKLLHSTARIEKVNAVDRESMLSTGTAFFFQYRTTSEGFGVPVLVTNRHCVEGYSLFRLLFPVKTPEGLIDQRGRIELICDRNDVEHSWEFHPDPNIDLAILPLGPVLQQLKDEGRVPYIKYLNPGHIPTPEQWIELDAIEDVLMIGYPNGIWDNKFIRPLVRKGITASHPAFPFNGRREFVIDAACFPGSSGSPVFIYNNQFWRDKSSGEIKTGERFVFLGILWGGPQHKVPKKTESIDIDSELLFEIPNNLGFVIRSDELLGFSSYINKLANPDDGGITSLRT